MTEREKSSHSRLLHNLRGPASVIKGFLSSIKNMPMSEKEKEYYEAAVKSAEKIEDALLISR